VVGAVGPRYRRRLLLVTSLAFAVAVVTAPANSFVLLYARNLLHMAVTRPPSWWWRCRCEAGALVIFAPVVLATGLFVLLPETRGREPEDLWPEDLWPEDAGPAPPPPTS
jgi:hypothetical protein